MTTDRNIITVGHKTAESTYLFLPVPCPVIFSATQISCTVESLYYEHVLPAIKGIGRDRKERPCSEVELVGILISLVTN